jgi:MFS transporter, NNP family, nitrate/nitrite transporter
MLGRRVEQPGMATVGFFWCFLMWFSTAAFSPSIAATYHLTRLLWSHTAALWQHQYLSAPLDLSLAAWREPHFGVPFARPPR